VHALCATYYIITTLVLRLPAWPLPRSGKRKIAAVVRQMPCKPICEQDQVKDDSGAVLHIHLLKYPSKKHYDFLFYSNDGSFRLQIIPAPVLMIQTPLTPGQTTTLSACGVRRGVSPKSQARAYATASRTGAVMIITMIRMMAMLKRNVTCIFPQCVSSACVRACIFFFDYLVTFTLLRRSDMNSS